MEIGAVLSTVGEGPRLSPSKIMDLDKYTSAKLHRFAAIACGFRGEVGAVFEALRASADSVNVACKMRPLSRRKTPPWSYLMGAPMLQISLPQGPSALVPVSPFRDLYSAAGTVAGNPSKSVNDPTSKTVVTLTFWCPGQGLAFGEAISWHNTPVEQCCRTVRVNAELRACWPRDGLACRAESPPSRRGG